MPDTETLANVEAVRRFTRFYTRKIGVLHEGLLGSPFSLTEARVIFELAHHNPTTATKLAAELGLDPGYLSRILRSFDEQALIERRPSAQDARRNTVSLTKKGQGAFAQLNNKSRQDVGAFLDEMSVSDQRRLVDAMSVVEGLLGGSTPPKVPYILRPNEPGDIGWVIQRHGALYAQEYGWDERFEAMVAEIAAKFIHEFDAKRERCWIAEKDGENVGSAFLVRRSDEIAQLRMLLVEPSARGLGIGHRLVDECIRFARRKGYGKVELWTIDILLAARRIYQTAGFQMVEEQRGQHFGQDLLGQSWELVL